MERALKRLQPDHGAVLRLRFYDGLKREEIAVKMGMSESTVKRLEYRAMAELRKPQNSRELEEYIDLRTDYYLGVKAKRQESPVEILVERREQMRRPYGWIYADTAKMPAQEA